MKQIYKYLATLGFVGYLPVAPGTFGSLAAMFLFLMLRLPFTAHLLVLALITVIGIHSSSYTEKVLNEKDNSHIVIDEVAGFCLSVVLIPHDLAYYLAAFFLFRFFDILKPPPIRNIERSVAGGAGIVADDLMAGLYTNLILQAWRILI
ncbi:MAG: phosphatidylglycerophosphatase A [Nitrospirota bacterium]|mgnify:CR=1 FL=1